MNAGFGSVVVAVRQCCSGSTSSGSLQVLKALSDCWRPQLLQHLRVLGSIAAALPYEWKRTHVSIKLCSFCERVGRG